MLPDQNTDQKNGTRDIYSCMRLQKTEDISVFAPLF